MGNLLAVGVSDHVVVEDNTAHSGELCTTSLKWIAAAGIEFLGLRLKLLVELLFRCLVEATVGPVTMRAEHSGQLARSAFRPIEAAGHAMPGEALEEDLFDCVLAPIDGAVDHGIGGGLAGAWDAARRRPSTEA